jgi:hypothetical protein
MPSEDFARLLVNALDEQKVDQGESTESGLSKDELEEWLMLFGDQDTNEEKKAR